MKWEGRRQSGNVQDRRSKSGGMTMGGVGLIAVLIFTLLTGEPKTILNM